MDIRKRFIPLFLVLVMLVSTMTALPVDVSAEEVKLYTSSVLCLDNNDDNGIGQILPGGSTSDSTILLDRRNVADPGKAKSRYREGYMTFDFTDYKADLLAGGYDSVQLSLTTNGNGLNTSSRWELYLFTPEMTAGLNTTNLPNHKACRDKGYIGYTQNLVWSGPTGMQDKKTYTSGNDFQTAVINYFRQNPEENIIGFRLMLAAGSTMGVMGAKNANVNWRPRITLNETSKLIEVNEVQTKIGESLPYYVTNNLNLPDRLSGYPDIAISWKSQNPELIADNGTVVKFPSELTKTSMVATLRHTSGIEHQVTYSMAVMMEGSFPGENSEVQDGKIDISFDFSGLLEGRVGFILKIPNSYLTMWKEYIIRATSGTEIARFVPNPNEEFSTINVTDYVGDTEANFSLESEDGLLLESDGLFILDTVKSDVLAAVKAVDSINLGNLSAVTESLEVPKQVDGIDIKWETTDGKHLGINGRVERPRSSETDAEVILSATTEVSNYVYKRTFPVTILKMEGEASGYPPLSDPNHISDENFFGVWDAAANKWKTNPILRYDKFPALNAVQEMAKAGDYEKAEEELLVYYRNRTGVPEYPLPNNEFYLNSEMIAEKIYGWMQVDNVVGMATIKPEWREYTIDLKIGTIPPALYLVESEMDGSYIEIGSKEGGYGATLEMTVNGTKQSLPVIADTYLTAGVHADETHGDDEMLYSQEASGETNGLPNPFGDDTKRPYFRFDTSGISGSISSPKLKLYARTRAGEEGAPAPEKKVFAFTTGNQKTFDENALSWALHYPMIFNFKNTGYVWDDAISNRWHLETEWQNYGSRLYPIEWLVGRYRKSGNELYAYRALEFMMALYRDQGHKWSYPRDLESGWRTEYQCILFFGTLFSNNITPEILTAQLKYLYDEARNLAGVSTNGAFNQISAKLSGAVRTMTYFPEIEADGKWDLAKSNFSTLYNNNLNKDGSYTEATTGYMSGVVDELRTTIEWLGLRDSKDDKVYQGLMGHYSRLVRYMFNFSMPYGLTIPWGDGPRSNNQAFAYNEAKMHPEIDPNNYYEYVVTQGASGTEPDYTSVLYPNKAIAFLKSGWSKNDFGAVINANFGGTHSHAADLALDVSAYGKVLLTEAGGGSYTADSPLAGIANKTYSHNTIEIDKKSQKGYDYGKLTSNQPQIMKLATNRIFDFVEAGSDGENPKGTAGEIYPGFDVFRKVLFLHNSYWIVSDYIIPEDENPHTYKQNWRPDQRSYLTVDPETKAMTTHYAQGANIQVIPADPETVDARVEQSYTTNPTYGDALTDYIRYCREDVTGPQTFDTILYPDQQGNQTLVAVDRIDLGNVPTVDATALKIEIGLNTGYYYSSNEANPPKRSFDRFSTDGQMSYVELARDGSPSVVALTKGSEVKMDDTTLVKTTGAVADLGVEWDTNTNTLNLSTEAGSLTGVEIYSEKNVKAVKLGGHEIDYTYDKDRKLIVIGETAKPTPTPPQSGSSGGRGSIGGNNNASNPIVMATPAPTATPAPSATPKPEAKDAFTDVSGHWAEEDILKMYEADVITAPEDKLFRTEDNITRAEFATFIVRGLKLPVEDEMEGIFSDISKDDWCVGPVESASRAGIIKGDEGGTFRPNSSISREEMAKMLIAACDYLKLPYEKSDISAIFRDYADISDWAQDSVSAAVALQLMKGMEPDQFVPKANSTRAQAVVVISRLLQTAEAAENAAEIEDAAEENTAVLPGNKEEEGEDGGGE